MEGLECVTENPLSSGASTDTSKGNSPSDKSDRTNSEPKATILGKSFISLIYTVSLTLLMLVCHTHLKGNYNKKSIFV